MSEYIKLAEPPVWVIQYPQCGACHVDLETDSDHWWCPVCGTSWSMDANDGDKGTLYEDWSGERLSGTTVPNDLAWHRGRSYEQAERDRIMQRIRVRQGVEAQ